MNKELENYIKKGIADFNQISPSRKEKLEKVAQYIQSKIEEGQTPKLNFICTHNSRRSHLTQIWTAVAAHYYGIKNIETYSGGTEATAFNPRAVAAIERAGFEVENPGGENPRYKVRISSDTKPMTCFSKIFDDDFNPDTSFAAIMTCSDADENCPFVPGTEFRASITYRDPKESDGTDREAEVYDERSKQIATEMFYMIQAVRGSNDV